MVMKNEKGFTLIELLVVVAIIGILAAIAIPQFAAYRNQSFCSKVESDVNNAMLAAEAYYTQNQKYPATVADAGFTDSPDVSVAYDGDGVATPFASIGTDLSKNCPK